jgi:hypothetical protein
MILSHGVKGSSGRMLVCCCVTSSCALSLNFRFHWLEYHLLHNLPFFRFLRPESYWRLEGDIEVDSGGEDDLGWWEVELRVFEEVWRWRISDSTWYCPDLNCERRRSLHKLVIFFKLFPTETL